VQLKRTRIEGLFEVEVTPHEDERGVFARTYDERIFASAGLPTNWPQCNTSWNRRRGTLRGMHFQAAPKEEPKLVRCTSGRVFDVAVDLRRDSRTYRTWVGLELSEAKRNALFIPAGMAHGFLTLEDDCEVYYQMGEVFEESLQRGVRWNDPAFAIAWPFEPTVISARDVGYADYAP
jgi:dTDP-4-dehydrorhamnose 3,5-epimerase